MSSIDSAILDLTERICHRFQRLTGRTNVWLAVQLTNLSIVVYFVWAGVYLLRADVPVRIALGLFCAGVVYGLSQTVFRVPVEASEQSAYQRVSRGLRNPRRVGDAMLRILFVMLSLMLLAPTWFLYVTLAMSLPLLGYSLVVLTTVVLYLLASDPLPPCAGTVTEWLTRRAPARVPSEARVPPPQRVKPGAER